MLSGPKKQQTTTTKTTKRKYKKPGIEPGTYNTAVCDLYKNRH